MKTRFWIFSLAICFGLVGCGGGGSSSIPTPPVNATVTITQQPNSVAVVAPAAAAFAVSAEVTGGGSLNYQWTSQAPGAAAVVVGSNSSTYEVDPTAVIMSGTKIAVTVTAADDPVVSQPATLTVTAATNPNPGTGDATPPAVVQTQSSGCTGSPLCTANSQTTLNNNAGDSLYIFVLVNYAITPQLTAVQTPTITDSNGTPILTPGVLALTGLSEPSPCVPFSEAGLPGGWCAVVYSEPAAAGGSHVFTISDPSTDFARYQLVAVEISGETKGIDAFFSSTGAAAPVGTVATFGNITTNLANETIIAIAFSESGALLSADGWTQLWVDPISGLFVIESLTAPTANSYAISFSSVSSIDTGDAFSIY